MNKHADVSTIIEYVPFSDLYLSDLNPRDTMHEASIDRLASNIAKLGLLQNLIGLRDQGDTKVGVVAGGRRLRALAALQDDPRYKFIPVQITDDPETARLWATGENSNREALHPVDEIRDYRAMAARNIAVADIALAYGATEKHVYRRLALANLPDVVLDALKADEITLGQAAAFTVANDAHHIGEVLEKHRTDAARGWGGLSEHQIKKLLKPESIKSSDRRVRFVSLETYQAAGGRITGDLFAEETLLDDPAILDALFLEKLEATAIAVCTDHGWKWADACPDAYVSWDYFERGKFERVYPLEGTLDEDETKRYDELADLANADVLDAAGANELASLEAKLHGEYSDEQKAHAGVLVRVDHDGEIDFTDGLIRQEDRAAAEAAGVLAPSRHKANEDAPKSPISTKLRNDLCRIETGARQIALLTDPKLALHLLAFQLCGKTGPSRAYGLRSDDVPNVPETDTGYALDKRLTTPERVNGDPWNRDLAQDFGTFRRRGDKKIMAVLHRYLVSLLDVSDEDLGSLIDKLVQRDTRSVWTPTSENFFGRVSGPYLNDLWRELLGLKAEHPTVTTFAKLRKAEKAAKLHDLFNCPETRAALGLSEAQLTRIDTWLPEGMV